MGIVIGVAGAHRVGKSTLCQLMEKSTITFNDRFADVKYVPTNLTSIYNHYGLTPSEAQKRPVFEFLEIQNAVLMQIIRTAVECRESEGVFITDRTPIDALAYLYANFNAVDYESLHFNRSMSAEKAKELYAALINYKKLAFEATLNTFDGIAIVQPGITIVEERGKATALLDEAYQSHLNVLMLGFATELLCTDKRLEVCVLRKTTTSLHDRLRAMQELFMKCAYKVKYDI